MDYVIGLGNYIKGDDSIGLHIADALVERSLEKGFEVIGINQDSLRIISYFEETTQRILLVDCVTFGGKPGETRLFTPDIAQSTKELAQLSTHEGDALKIIQMGKELNYPIPAIKILGIQPLSMNQQFELSETLQNRMDEYIVSVQKTMASIW